MRTYNHELSLRSLGSGSSPPLVETVVSVTPFGSTNLSAVHWSALRSPPSIRYLVSCSLITRFLI